jgi:RNA polymerase sigma factor (sigma-70 family)
MPRTPQPGDRLAPSAQQITDLYIKHHEQLERIVASKVRTSRHTIEEACAYAWAEMATYRPVVHNPLGWLATAAIREAIRLAQRERRDDPLLAIPHPTAPLEVTVTAHEALEAMAALPVTQREVLTLAVAGFSAPEIASRTGLHVEAVFGRLRRARAQLRKALR